MLRSTGRHLGVGARDHLGRPTRRAARRALAAWRRSLQLRVVATTLLLSALVVALIGAALFDKVTSGLLAAKTTAALSEASSGFRQAQQTLDTQSQSASSADVGQTLTRTTLQLTAGGGSAGLYDVVLLAADSTAGATGSGRSPRASQAVRPTATVSLASIPGDLREAVRRTNRIAYRYVDLQYDDGWRSAGLAVGSPLEVPGAGTYEAYYLFPLESEQRTVSLLQRTLAAAGVGLVLLLAGVAGIVTRQVVTPVRLAARIAERLAAGRLEERMPVHGQDDLARLASSFNKMAASLQRQISQLENLSRVQRRFVADVSHELRTPLTTVRMAADVLHESRRSFDPAVARSAELLQNQLDRFEALLSELLEISRHDAGAAVLEAEPTDLCDLARRVVDAAVPLAERHGCRLLVKGPGAACTAEVDPRRIERVLRNLVDNAVEHSEGRDVVVQVTQDTEAVAVGVRDYGIGLRPGESALVFNRFWRADPARARTIGGTGLGLAIALEDARLHRGWLQAWGEPGGGSLFRLTLPKAAGHELRRSPMPLEPPDAASRRRARLTGALAEATAAAEAARAR